MRSFGVVSVLVAIAPRLAHADGWWETCRCGSGRVDGVTVAAGLLLTGFVAYRLSRKRRR